MSILETKRAYSSETRESQAAQTKSSILESAKKLFQLKGFGHVTIQMIAEEAKVSQPTVYALFKSKRGLLQALIDHALPPREFTSLVEDSMKETSPEKCLAITAKLSRQIYDKEKELIDLLRGATTLSPEFKELEEERERRRYERQGEYVKKMMKMQAMNGTLSLEKARDILWSLTGRDLYRLLVIERGWSSDAYEEWLFQTLSLSLLK